MKKSVIIAISVTTVLAVIIGAFIIIRLFTTNGATQKSNSSSLYVEKGLEKMADIAKLAVENYATQNISESASARQARLSAYFTSDSPAYGRELEIQSSNNAIKTSAQAESITSYAASEGALPFLIVKTKIKCYFNSTVDPSSQIQTSEQKYWVTIAKTSDGTYKAVDAGLWYI